MYLLFEFEHFPLPNTARPQGDSDFQLGPFVFRNDALLHVRIRPGTVKPQVFNPFFTGGNLSFESFDFERLLNALPSRKDRLEDGSQPAVNHRVRLLSILR